MKLEIFAFLAVCMMLPLEAQIKRPERKSLLDSDPDVVYLEQTELQPILLKVIKEAPVYGDKNGTSRRGQLKANQTVKLEAITEKSYRVRGEGTNGDVSGWVAPWAFSSSDPEFVAHLKQLYQRQIQVQALITEKKIAVGMTLAEVTSARGKPTKTSLRKTAAGQSGSWDYIDYEDVNNYVTEIDPRTGITYRRLVSVTRVEKGKTSVEFADNLVTAIEESETRRGGNTRIIVPPLVFRW
jgi:hypothetical protein